jgi:transcriptional regulator with XRE-family HTH domain
MNKFILDLITARGWSIRHLGELTDISYSGIRDYLRGLEHRLSIVRLSRVIDLLELDKEKGLKPRTLYTWSIEIQVERLAALNRVLQGTIDRYTQPDAAGALSSPADTQSAPSHKFEAIPLLGGDTEGLPAPYWILRWQDIYILIQWQLPKTQRIKKIPDFYSQRDSSLNHLPLVNPDIKAFSSICWALGMEISPEKITGIQLTSAQLVQLKKTGTTDSLKLETLKDWLQAEPSEDPFWTLMHNEPEEPKELTENAVSTKDFSGEESLLGTSERQQEPPLWTWDMVLQRLKQRYSRPEEVVRILKLK